MNYYKGLEDIGKTGEFKNIPNELLHDYINDFTLEFNNRSLVKKLNIAVVVRQSEQLVCKGKCDHGYKDEDGNELFCSIKNAN